MATSRVLGPILSGTKREGAGVNQGFAVLSQTKTFTFTAASTASFTAGILPANAQIVDIKPDIYQEWDSSTAGLTLGTSAASARFLGSGSGIDLNNASGRQVDTPNAAQASNWANVGAADVTVMGYILCSSAPSQGSGRVTLIYVQK